MIRRTPPRDDQFVEFELDGGRITVFPVLNNSGAMAELTPARHHVPFAPGVPSRAIEQARTELWHRLADEQALVTGACRQILVRYQIGEGRDRCQRERAAHITPTPRAKSAARSDGSRSAVPRRPSTAGELFALSRSCCSRMPIVDSMLPLRRRMQHPRVSGSRGPSPSKRFSGSRRLKRMLLVGS